MSKLITFTVTTSRIAWPVRRTFASDGATAAMCMARPLRVASVATLLAIAAATCPASTASEIAAGGDVKGKTILITGGDSGLGLESGKALAAAGASLIVLSHQSETKGKAAASTIARVTGTSMPTVVGCDLSSLASVRRAAEEVRRLTTSIDVLMDNAGLGVGLVDVPNTTEDGLDRVVAVNLVGMALLTELLLPTVRAATPPGRVVVVSSRAGQLPCSWGSTELGRDYACTILDGLPTLLRATPRAGLNAWGFHSSNYGLTKYLEVFYVAALARREAALSTGVRAYSLHPGLVRTPMVTKVVRYSGIQRTIDAAEPVATGAATQTWLAAAAALPEEGNGKFFDKCEWDLGKNSVLSTFKGTDAERRAYEDGVLEMVLDLTELGRPKRVRGGSLPGGGWGAARVRVMLAVAMATVVGVAHHLGALSGQRERTGAGMLRLV